MKFLKLFSELNKSDSNIAGGKGASLGEMLNAGIPVPDGFVILASTFESFIESTDLVQEIDAILDKVNHKGIHTIELASEKIQGLILSKEVPEEIRIEIQDSFKKLDTKFVAVRSSATAEDGAEHAWAGQLESYLNTREEQLFENIRKCWASLFTPRAIFYRFEKGLHTTKISMAVVVQKMVESEISGIAFSVHPVTEDRNQIIVEAGYGLGEAIVSGSITPDSYVVEKQPRKIIDINVSTQTRKLIKKQEGGNEWVDIGEPEASTQVLSEKQILKLADIILGIENHYGFPCDIEWAYEKGKFYIVQCRPITTLSKSSEEIREVYLVFTRDHNQWMNEMVDYVFVHELPQIFGAGISTQITFFTGRTSEWYRFSDEMLAIKKAVLDQSLDSPLFSEQTQETFLKEVTELRQMLSIKALKDRNGKEFLDEVKERFIKTYPPYLIALFVPGPWREDFLKKHGSVGQEVVERLFHSREKSEGLLKDITNFMREWLGPELVEKGYPITAVTLLSVTEVENFLEKGTLPTFDKIEERAKGFVHMYGEIMPTQDLFTFLRERNISIRTDTADVAASIIKGFPAYKSATVKGEVKIIMNSFELDKFKEGMILVTPMTAPEYLPIIQKALAVVTDEGGITCHAAIVARELKKPCLIGTKIATKIFNDGDTVEVDTNSGTVRFLKK